MDLKSSSDSFLRQTVPAALYGKVLQPAGSWAASWSVLKQRGDDLKQRFTKS